MEKDSAIILDDFLSENWTHFESFCEDRGMDAESIIKEVQEQTGQDK